MARFTTALLVASATQVLSLCSHNTFLHPRAENGTVEVKNFGYRGNIGPLFWATLDAGRVNERCASGSKQSPIDMVPEVFTLRPASDLEIVVPDFPEGTEFENLGTTIEVIARPGGTLKVDGKTFELQQAHFHLPSEHLDAGTSRAMEMHAVWQSAEQEIAVIGTYIDVVVDGAAPPATTAPAAARFRRRQAAAPAAAGASTFLETVLSKADAIATPGSVTQTPPLVLSEIVNLWKAGSFQAYSGSLTTPPCSEGVNWFVSTQTLRISAATFEKARSVIGFNSRLTQNAPGQLNVQMAALATIMSDLSQAAVAAPPVAAAPAAE
ncbi:alpha carbonic anhydrase [Rhypophila decipiens]|uniref:carbonic anhydrase n=1 Tax=Rhypophila decipiens TaxID=261697 RepID=A0AAN7B5G9_9PEZI|nr:alpha carbonic anhydrase [Rhypophila decipiens]